MGEDLEKETNSPKALLLVCGSVYNGLGLLISSENVPQCVSACSVCLLEYAAQSDLRGGCRPAAGKELAGHCYCAAFVSIFHSTAKLCIKMQQWKVN